MKLVKNTLRLPVLLIPLIVILLPIDLFGQLAPGASLLKFEAGYLSGKGEESSFSVEGTSFAASFERISTSRQTGIGVMIGYFSVDDNILQDNGSLLNVQFTSLPVYGIFNYYFTTTKLIPYAGLGLGFHLSTGESAFNSYQSDRGMAVALPAGVKWFPISNLAFDANYRLNYLGSSYLGNGMAHTINLGIA